MELLFRGLALLDVGREAVQQHALELLHAHRHLVPPKRPARALDALATPPTPQHSPTNEPQTKAHSAKSPAPCLRFPRSINLETKCACPRDGRKSCPPKPERSDREAGGSAPDLGPTKAPPPLYTRHGIQPTHAHAHFPCPSPCAREKGRKRYLGGRGVELMTRRCIQRGCRGVICPPFFPNPPNGPLPRARATRA
jgi:hypothetical protein